MTPNAFIGRTEVPTERDIAAALGPAKPAWDSIVVDMAQELGLKRGKRNIVHLAPCQGCFAVLFILGDRAVSAARASKLGARATKLIDEAPRYPEGTGIRLEVTGPRHIALIKKLARIKLDN
jgi:hypothetical protein